MTNRVEVPGARKKHQPIFSKSFWACALRTPVAWSATSCATTRAPSLSPWHEIHAPVTSVLAKGLRQVRRCRRCVIGCACGFCGVSRSSERSPKSNSSIFAAAHAYQRVALVWPARPPDPSRYQALAVACSQAQALVIGPLVCGCIFGGCSCSRQIRHANDARCFCQVIHPGSGPTPDRSR